MITTNDLKLIPFFYKTKLYNNGLMLEIKIDNLTINIFRNQAVIFETAENIEIHGKGLKFKHIITLSKKEKLIYINTF
jgi:hypothetical protein